MYRCLTNLATGVHEQTAHVLQCVPNLIILLSNNQSNYTLSEQICWTIGNIAGDSDEFRKILLGNSCLQPLLNYLFFCLRSIDNDIDMKEITLSGARTAAWALSNLARGNTDYQTLFQYGTYYLLLHRTISNYSLHY